MLTTTKLEDILAKLSSLVVGVVGDLFLDRYLDIDPTLTEPSLETGLDAYQVVRVRSNPGAAGTIINNLAVFGVRRICVISVIGADGEGYELMQALDQLGVVENNWVFRWGSLRTPTYTKPMLLEPGRLPRELNRLDIKNRSQLPAGAEERVLKALAEVWPQVDALLVLDQVREADCGVVTGRVRDQLAELGQSNPNRIILADSRERIGQFRSVWLKPNESECLGAIGGTGTGPAAVQIAATEIARRAGRPVFCTRGHHGILVLDPRTPGARAVLVPAYPVKGSIDIVGAGDSTSAAIACALAAGAGLEEAAAFGNLVASVTIQQIGTTGTASPQQIRQRWEQIGES